MTQILPISRQNLAPDPVWEVPIGLGLRTGIALRITLLLFLYMIGTVSPLFFFPQETFSRFPLGPTLEGQYILKNMG